VRPANLPDEVPAIRELFREYAALLGIDLCFQRFEEELAGLPGAYAPPRGRLLVAEQESQLAGCVALRPLDAGLCEMKRLFVRPAFRGQGIGRLLIEHLLIESTMAEYKRIVLDTLPVMVEAIALYRVLGFEVIEPYCFNPIAGALYLGKELSPPLY
jgi:ribosomal protein S18 acetylase RimI-like enzyme